MHVVVAGISHKTASLELRERLALDEEAALHVSRDLLDEGVACEAVALSTCNRTELYLYGRDSLAARQAALSHLARHAGVTPGELEPSLYSYSGDRAISHLFRVTSSLDSMVDRRGADRRAAQGRLPAGLRRRLHGRGLQPAVPARARSGEARAHRDRHRRAAGQRQLGRRRARPAGVRQAPRPHRAHRRRRRDQRAHGDAPQGARHREDPGDQPHVCRRRGTGAAGRRQGRALRGPRGPPCRGRHRHQLHLGAALRDHSRARGAGLQAPPSPPDVPHRHRRAARPRPRDQPRARRLPVRHRRPAARGRGRTAASARRRRCTPSASSSRNSRA